MWLLNPDEALIGVWNEPYGRCCSWKDHGIGNVHRGWMAFYWRTHESYRPPNVISTIIKPMGIRRSWKCSWRTVSAVFKLLYSAISVCRYFGLVSNVEKTPISWIFDTPIYTSQVVQIPDSHLAEILIVNAKSQWAIIFRSKDDKYVSACFSRLDNRISENILYLLCSVQPCSWVCVVQFTGSRTSIS